MSHRIRLLLCNKTPRFARTKPSVQTQRLAGVGQRGSPPLRPFCVCVGRVWSNPFNCNISLISNEIMNNKR